MWVPRFHGGSHSETPCPRRSGANTWNASSRSSASRRKRPPQLVTPWRHRSGGASGAPQSCTCNVMEGNYRACSPSSTTSTQISPPRKNAVAPVLADTRAHGATAFFLGGDYVGFGPFPRETFALLRDLEGPAAWIRGNAER